MNLGKVVVKSVYYMLKEKTITTHVLQQMEEYSSFCLSITKMEVIQWMQL